MSTTLDAGRRWALVTASPGEELRVFGWAELTRPVHSILTDGSGRDGISRVERSRELVGLGAVEPGAMYGALTTRDVYAALLDRNIEFFLKLAHALCADFLARGIDSLLVNDAEGHDAIQDVTSFVSRAAAGVASRARGDRLEQYVYSAVDHPDLARERPAAVQIVLTPEMFERKLEAARRMEEMSSDISARIAQWGANALRIETIHPAEERKPQTLFRQERPSYEGLGERRVAQGHYASAIRFREHILPLAIALDELQGA